jgi:hypothetical protein
MIAQASSAEGDDVRTTTHPGEDPRAYDLNLRRLAREAFARHAIRERSDGRWVIARPDKEHPGEWQSCYWTEVIVLRGSKLLVHGDISHVIFAYCDTSDPRDALAWMGRCEDFGYYVHQKATIGTGHEIIDKIEPDVLLHELHEHIAGRTQELRDDWPGDEVPSDSALAEAVAKDEQIEAYREAIETLGYGDAGGAIRGLYEARCRQGRGPVFGDCECLHGLGKVVDPRVYYAHAALRRLCDLLDEEDRHDDQ